MLRTQVFLWTDGNRNVVGLITAQGTSYRAQMCRYLSFRMSALTLTYRGRLGSVTWKVIMHE